MHVRVFWSIAEFLNMPVSEVLDALEFWAQAGILTRIGQPEAAMAPKPEIKEKPIPPRAQAKLDAGK